MEENILEIKRLTKHFGGVHAVQNLSVVFARGAITGIIGPNGSGKTTLVNLLTGMLPMDGGVIVSDGATLRRMRAHEARFYGITRTFQNIRLFEQMTVLDNLLVVLTERRVFASLFERHGAYHLKKAEALLRQVGLWEKHNELALHLSYGQRKLLEIARAIGTDARVFLFDEPFAGLFPEMREIVKRQLEALREQGAAVLLIEHNMELIRQLSDYVVVLDSGKLLAEGKPESVLRRRDVLEAYLGE